MRLRQLGLAASAAGLAWGHFEAGWPRLERLHCPLPGLPSELDGLRIAHLSDFHLGVPSRGASAVERAVEWVEEQRPDLTLVSGDLLSRRSGEPELRSIVARLPSCYAVLGNHDFSVRNALGFRRYRHLHRAVARALSARSIRVHRNTTPRPR